MLQFSSNFVCGGTVFSCRCARPTVSQNKCLRKACSVTDMVLINSLKRHSVYNREDQPNESQDALVSIAAPQVAPIENDERKLGNCIFRHTLAIMPEESELSPRKSFIMTPKSSPRSTIFVQAIRRGLAHLVRSPKPNLYKLMSI